MKSISSVFVHCSQPSAIDDIDWMVKRGMANCAVNSSVLSYDAWYPTWTIPYGRMAEVAEAHRKAGLHYAPCLFSHYPWWNLDAFDPMLAEWLEQAKTFFDLGILPGTGNTANFYFGPEPDFITFNETYVNPLKIWSTVINTLYDLYGKYPMTFLWSPYISVIEANLTNIQMAYAAFLRDLQVAVKVKKRKIKLVSAIQDGVGCWNNPIYWEGFGDRTPDKTNPDYQKLLGIIKAHNLAVGKGNNVIAKVNAELFAYGPELKEWVFGSVDRISNQVKFQGKYSSKGMGPCCILTNKSMGVNYENSKFKEGIQ